MYEKTKRRAPWTAQEKRLIEQYYADRGPRWNGWDTLLPGRTRSSIQLQANRLGISSRFKPWEKHRERALKGLLLAFCEKTGYSPREVAKTAVRLLNNDVQFAYETRQKEVRDGQRKF